MYVRITIIIHFVSTDLRMPIRQSLVCSVNQLVSKLITKCIQPYIPNWISYTVGGPALTAILLPLLFESTHLHSPSVTYAGIHDCNDTQKSQVCFRMSM